MQNLSILGSTGSIGQNTLEVLRLHKDQFHVYGLAAHSNVEVLARQCLEWEPEVAALVDQQSALELADILRREGKRTEVLVGEEGLAQVAGSPQITTVVAAIVGAAGLEPTFVAVKAGKKVLLANKEALVMSGALFTQAAKACGATILPVDSEHNAIFQCLPQNCENLEQAGVLRLLLTGSGGPFRDCPLSELAQVTPDQACAHPNWDMGKKISVDSATMMNKGLEFIEACWLFNLTPEKIKIVIHPQSIVHSMVQYVDGSVLAQMGKPDMRTPIAHCLAWPKRIESGVEALDLAAFGSLDFSEPDYERFPCLDLAIQAVTAGGDVPAALNAANEVAVSTFLEGGIQFTEIAKVIEKVLVNWAKSEPKSLEEVIKADSQARELAGRAIESLQNKQSRIMG